MKIELLDHNTVKIQLSAEDMGRYEVTYEDMDYKSPDTRRLIVHILSTVKKETGLDLSNGRIFIEAFPYQDDGCVLYISMLGPEESIAAQEEKPKSFNTPLVFAFGDIDSLGQACKTLFQQYSHLFLKSSLYRMEGKYVLLLYSYFKLDKKLISIAGEWGTFLGRGRLRATAVKEHGSLIAEENAVETMVECLC